MTLRDLPRSQFFSSLPEQLQAASVVFVVAADPDTDRVAADAWAVATALAALERRTCLVDLSVTRPLLDPDHAAPEGEGIVDAFLYGASMQRVAAEQETPGLFVITAGTRTDQPDAVWQHARWPRLSRGFAAERAVLVLLGPPEALAEFSATPDFVILLAPPDVEPPGRAAALAQADVPLVRLIPDAPAPTPGAEGEPTPGPTAPAGSGPAALPRRSLRRWGVAGAAVAVIGLAAAAVVLLEQSDDAAPEPAPPPTTPSRPVPSPPPAATGGDSLFYTVQVAAFTSADNAFEQAAEFWAAGWQATVAPVRLGRQGTWHRLLVGALPGPAEAEATLQGLWDAGLLERPNGTILRTPLALEVAARAERELAETALEGVRAAGSAGYIVRALDGTYRVLVGAFETAEQAERADSILDTTDLHGTIVRRAGIAR
jgi:cell division protein FtsN